MKNGLFLIGLYISGAFDLPAQETTKDPDSSPHIILNWEGPVVQEFPGQGKKKMLYFKGAQYDLSNSALPSYTKEFPLPAGCLSATAAIRHAVFQPLDEQEKMAFAGYSSDDQNKISGSIAPAVITSIHRKKRIGSVYFVPVRKNPSTGMYEKLVSFSLETTVTYGGSGKHISAPLNYASHSVLASGAWYKVAVLSDGIYKMDYAFFKSMGVDPDSIDPRNLRLYGNGGGQLPFANSGFHYDDIQENAIAVIGENDGKFDSTDYVLFYGQSQHRWKLDGTDNKFHHFLNIYSDTTYYLINTDIGLGKRILIQSSSLSSPTNTVTSFDDFQYHELEQNNLLKSGRIWMGEVFDIINTYSFNFNFPNIESSSKAYAKVDVGARRDIPGTDFTWSAGNSFSSLNVPGVTTSNIYSTYYRILSDTLNFYPTSSTIPVTVSKITPSPAIGWLNYIELNARRNLQMNGGQMAFRDKNSVGAGTVSQFIISNATAALQVWEITDHLNIRLQSGNFSGTNFDFTLPSDSLREFIAFNGQFFLSPIPNGPVQNQDLHAMAQSDLIIVVHPLFISQANALADLHRDIDNMSVSVATTQQVYNEFSSGAQDVSAIRNFVKMFYDRAAGSAQLPKYLLLFGRGSFNLKGISNNTNFVPAYESLNSADPTNSYPSDDFYGMLDSTEGVWDGAPGDDDMLDIGVGRIPVKSVSEADIAVNKITKYTSVPGTIETGNSCSTDVCYGLGDWINSITFCADDEDASIHLDQAEQITVKIRSAKNKVLPVDSLHQNYNIDKIYLDAYQQVSTPGGERYTDATNALNRRMERGSLIVNYTGHGGELGWAHERFLEIFHINSWKNQCRLPLFFTATCEFSRWDDPDRTSAGELTFLNPNGGSIGLMSTTRVVYSGPNAVLNDNFYDYTFSSMANGKMPRLGDLQMETKKSMPSNQINHRNFSLLSDPALSLNYPEYQVITTEINGASVNPSSPDTAHALSRVTVKGEIKDYNGNLMTNFNGILYPTVYDKPASITTLSNDGSLSPARTFQVQKNVLFKGKASITGGKFSFTFIIPKDISYNYGKVKISYYAHNGFEDAAGYSEDLIVGGTDSTAVQDASGPVIKLFMNDDKFIFGGVTNTEPKIYAVVSDSNGINTAGNSIGHDITAVLDDNTSQPYVLNDYYESDLDNYKKGTVRYPLSNLTEGKHTLTFKVWDVYNNSSSAYTEFVVASSAELALKHVLNYPNPFTTRTSFYFEHNQCCLNMDVQIQVFTVSGKLVKTIHQFTNMEGYRSEPIDWDGRDDYGDKLGRGVYIYRIRVKVGSTVAEQFQKLVILK